MEASSLPRHLLHSRPLVSEKSLASLPPEILEKIISYLPIHDAVRTSAISRSWRHFWESVPGLALEWGDGADPAAVDAVLTRYSGPVRSFNFRLEEEAFELADLWVYLLAEKGVQSLTLRFILDGNDAEPHYLDAPLFLCHKLTCLRLSGCDVPGAPLGLGGFPNLTWCSLDSVGFTYNGERELETLISQCPLLEVLLLNEVWFPYDEDDDNEFEGCVIKAPNLRHFKIGSGDDFGWKIEEVPSIETVEINFKHYRSDRDFVQLLTTLAKVRKLVFKMPLTERNILDRLSSSFENLKSLSLHTDFCRLSTILSTICLLKHAPNLEELSFEIQYENLQVTEVSVDFLNAQWAESLLANLKSVNMHLATCQSNEMNFIMFLLFKAPILQKFDICLNKNCPKTNEELLVEILKYRRASPHAKICLERVAFV